MKEPDIFTNTKEALRRLRMARQYVFDMDGTVCLGERPFPDAVELVNSLQSRGRGVAFFTNNTSRNVDYYLAKLTGMGFRVLPGQVISSAEVTARFITERRPGSGVYLVGSPDLRHVLVAQGVRLVEDSPDIVLSSFDTTLTYERLERACTFIRRGAEWLSTHPDVNCPTEDGFIPDSGAINAAISASTGVASPRYFGKPYPEAAEMLCSLTGADKSHMVIVGDRMYTDIALGKRNGILSVLVLSGETTSSMLDSAAEADLPDLVFAGAGDILEHLENQQAFF